MVTEITPVYLENRYAPVAKNSEEEDRCVDDYGNVACPFCDMVICPERKVLKLGDKCWRCKAEIVRFEDMYQSDEAYGAAMLELHNSLKLRSGV